jgi:hypothetical protein
MFFINLLFTPLQETLAVLARNSWHSNSSSAPDFQNVSPKSSGGPGVSFTSVSPPASFV